MIYIQNDDAEFLRTVPSPQKIRSLERSGVYEGHWVLYFNKKQPSTASFWLLSSSTVARIWPFATWANRNPSPRIVAAMAQGLKIVTQNFAVFELWVHGGLEEAEKIASSASYETLWSVATSWAEHVTNFGEPNATEIDYLSQELKLFRRNQSKYMATIRSKK